jgi:hypothetical protein
MLVVKNELGNRSTESSPAITVAPRKSTPKTLGTRAGVLQDWRQGSKKSGKQSGERTNRFRDGR